MRSLDAVNATYDDRGDVGGTDILVGAVSDLACHKTAGGAAR
jgi:hypothetical protein